MNEIVLRDIDAVLEQRIQRIAKARGWSAQETLLHLLEQGLFVCENEVRGGFQDEEVDVLSEAILVLKQLPAGKSFA
ncbi:hypothetical protein [Pseudoxanthomonas dokdonensis]|uniref:Ribbon-helix-helix protein CopG domain-containing protein n=1 Tax=Pseudoxanthomonas dokdonensis TaxID=344882 RepID=A0A0R0CR78_9GAMM|nr:hypothetical protein [Pseudoxanthomonas dokdonensis]KRG71904.1 hypothetical protein ABB29_00025 [Pseudoxanthomonas dokdonensis]